MKRSLIHIALVATLVIASGAVAHAGTPPDFIGKWSVPGAVGGLASDALENIYATDRTHNSVLVYNSTGVLLHQWGSTGSEDGQFRDLWGIAVSPNGEVWVADYNNSRLQIFDSLGNFLRKWDFPGVDEIGQPLWPGDVTFDAQGNIYVSHAVAWHRIRKYDSQGNLLVQFDPGHVTWGARVAVDGEGFVYGNAANGLTKYDPQGHFLWTITQIPPYEPHWQSWGYCGQEIRPRDLFVDPSNNVFLSMTCGGGNQFVYKLNPDGVFITRFGCVDNIDPQNPWFCRDPDGPGPFVVGDGQFQNPGALTMDRHGIVYVYDEMEGGRIQKFAWTTVGVNRTSWSNVKTLFR